MKYKLILCLLITSLCVNLIACYTPPSSARTTQPQVTSTTIVYTFNGPQNSSVRVTRNNQLQQTITAGNSARITVPNGSHTLEAQLIQSGNTRINPEVRRLTVNAQGQTININITATFAPSGIAITDFSIRGNTSTSGATTTAEVRFVNADALNVRSSPENRGNANRVDTINRNTRVEIIERTRNHWVRIRYGNGRTGWVDSSYLSNTQTSVATPSSGTIQMTFNQFARSNFTSSIQSRTFSFPVSNGTRYNVWLDDWDQDRSNVDAVISARYSDGTNIFSNVDIAYPTQFTANRTSTVILTVAPRTRGHTGNFGVGYNRPN